MQIGLKGIQIRFLFHQLPPPKLNKCFAVWSLQNFSPNFSPLKRRGAWRKVFSLIGGCVGIVAILAIRVNHSKTYVENAGEL